MIVPRMRLRGWHGGLEVLAFPKGILKMLNEIGVGLWVNILLRVNGTAPVVAGIMNVMMRTSLVAGL